MQKSLLVYLCAAVAALLSVGCTSPRHGASEQLFYAGQYQMSADVFTAEARLQSHSADVLTNLYMGSGDFMAGNNQAAFDDFSRAYDGIDEQERTFNWGSNYMARTYDEIMSNTYQGLTLLFMKRPDQARVAFNRVEESQGKASERNRRAIEKRQEEIQSEQTRNANANAMLTSAQNDQANQKQLSDFQNSVKSWGAYADYENPASRYISGLFRIFYGMDASDADKAVFQLKRAYGMTNTNVSRQCYDIAEAIANGRTKNGQPFGRGSLRNTVFVLFENGLGPKKVEKRFDLIVPYRKPFHVGIALPELVKRDAAYPYLSVTDGKTEISRTEFLCDFDRIVAKEYDNELPGLIASEVTKAVIRVALQVIANEIAEKNGGKNAALWTGIAGSIISYSVTSADIRNWNYLPKEFQACILERPASGTIAFLPPGANQPCATVALPEKGPFFIYIKIPVNGKQPLCNVVTGL